MSKHTQHSAYREKLIEHLFVGELLKLSWIKGDCEIEVAKPEVDSSGISPNESFRYSSG